jgi:diadenosine tetraphosphate (Ap4A) HIT family hydrolase
LNAPCPFCAPDPERVLHEDEQVRVIRDCYPVSPDHVLIVPRRHIGSFFETTQAERLAILSGLDLARRVVNARRRPDGFNIGINDGTAAGQTVHHLHVHLIPRFLGDQPDPRGGVRWVLPEKADYWSD